MKTAGVIAAVIASVTVSSAVLGGVAYAWFSRDKTKEDPLERLRSELIAKCADQEGAASRSRSDNYCFSELAKKWSKAEYCDALLATPGRVDDERARCRAEVAQSTGDLELCKQSGASVQTERCLRDLATRLEKPELCEAIEGAFGREQCITNIADALKQPAMCDKLAEGKARDGCISRVAGALGEVSRCARLQEKYQRESCARRPARGDARTCLALPVELRAECLLNSDAPIDDVAAACDGSSSCLSKLASSIGPAACALIPDEKAFERPQCFQNLAATRSSGGGNAPGLRESMCEKQPSAGARDECFGVAGRLEGGGSACLRVMDLRQRKSCLFEAGKRDASLCKLLTDRADLVSCVAQSNQRTWDASICAVLDASQRKSCEQRVSSYIEEQVRRGR